MQLIHDIVMANPGHQFVLYFEDLSPVTITPADLSPDSTFFRRSKKRLGEYFYPVDSGALQGTGGDAASVTVYKSARASGLSDYVLYESDKHEYIQAWVKAKTKSKPHTHYRQMTINNITKPCNAHEMHAWMKYVPDQGIILSFKTDSFEHETKPLVNLYPDIPWYYTATIYLMHMLESHKDKISRTVIFYPDKISLRNVYNLSSHKWRPYRYIMPFVNSMDKYKALLSDMDIVFKA